MQYKLQSPLQYADTVSAKALVRYLEVSAYKKVDYKKNLKMK